LPKLFGRGITKFVDCHLKISEIVHQANEDDSTYTLWLKRRVVDCFQQARSSKLKFGAVRQLLA
jgi:hypothetical protein